MGKPLMPSASASVVAEWIIAEVQKRGEISHREIAEVVRSRFGEQYVAVLGRTGEIAVRPPVMKRVTALHVGRLSYDPSERTWRARSGGG